MIACTAQTCAQSLPLFPQRSRHALGSKSAARHRSRVVPQAASPMFGEAVIVEGFRETVLTRSASTSTQCGGAEPASARGAVTEMHSKRVRYNSRRSTVQHGPGMIAGFANEDWAENQAGEMEQRSKVSAEIKVHAPADVLWGVLTDFSAHVHLMPNVEQCEQLPSRQADTTLLFQKVFSQTPFWRVEASAMLEYRQKRASSWRKMNFRMVSGDFAELSGHWVVAESSPYQSVLRYEIVFLPTCKAAIPCAMKQFLAKQVLPCNIMALVAHAETISQGSFTSQADDPSLSSDSYMTEGGEYIAPGWIPDRRPMYLGVSSVPLPGQRSAANHSQRSATQTSSRPEKRSLTSVSWAECENDGSSTVEPLAGASSPVQANSKFSDMEVHIRKLDTDEKLHWRLLSSVPVHASADAIWKVLTNYEKLDEVVPLLLVSEEKKGVRSNENRPANLKRIRQVAAKKLPYVQLHSEVVLDVLEKPGVDDSDTWELQFRHHKSSFKMLQGKWVIERIPGTGGSPKQPSHVLKYAVELAVSSKPSRLIDLMEPLIQRSIAEDLPDSLHAIRKAAESLQGQEAPKKTSGREVLQRAEKTFDMFEELRAELTALYGSRMQLPNRKELVASGRVDLINAIKTHGGYPAVAEKLQWSIAKVTRRRRGYWSIMANVQHELDLFNDEFDQPMDTIPRKSYMQKLGRYDLAKGLERNGGAKVVAEMLGYTIASDKAAVKEAQTTRRDVASTDVAESATSEMMDEAQAAQLSDNISLPSVDELLQDTESYSVFRDEEHMDTGVQYDTAHASEFTSVDEGLLRDSLVGGDQATRANLGSNAFAWARGDGSQQGRTAWVGGSSDRKLNLNIRDVDVAPYSAAWGAASKSYRQKVLSESDLARLLSESKDSRDSI